MRRVCIFLLFLPFLLVTTDTDRDDEHRPIVSSNYFIHGTKFTTALFDTKEFVQRRRYGFELHTVITQDGYVLELHKILPKFTSPQLPVLFIHGIMASSSIFVLQDETRSLAFQLASRGQPVWLINMRGNKYSSKHINASIGDSYWNFSWDEMAKYDIPDTIEYILRTEGKSQLIVVGYSMGTTVFYAACQHRPDIRAKVKLAVSFGAIAYTHNSASPLIKILVPMAGKMENLSRIVYSSLTDQNPFSNQFLFRFFCELTKTQRVKCVNLFFLLMGYDTSQLDPELIPFVVNNIPSGTSLNTIFHYIQNYNNKRFSMYDFGPETNLLRYNRTTPPDYDLGYVIMPHVIYYGDNDWLAHPTDVLRLIAELGSRPMVRRINSSSYNHIDFVWGSQVDKLFLKDVLHTMREIAEDRLLWLSCSR